MDQISKMSEIDKFNKWFNVNKNALEHLYYKLINMAELYNIHINNTQNSKDDFITMMYKESSGELLDEILYSEFFIKN